jgi:hypothetical protein
VLEENGVKVRSTRTVPVEMSGAAALRWPCVEYEDEAPSPMFWIGDIENIPELLLSIFAEGSAFTNRRECVLRVLRKNTASVPPLGASRSGLLLVEGKVLGVAYDAASCSSPSRGPDTEAAAASATLDPKNPEHVGALMMACATHRAASNRGAAWLARARKTEASGLVRRALDILGDAERSAKMLAVWIEAHGVSVEDSYGIGPVISLLTECDAERRGVDVRLCDVPTIFEELAHIPVEANDRREQALAALAKVAR